MKRWELISIPHVYECERVYMSGRLLSCRLVHPAVHYRVPVPVQGSVGVHVSRHRAHHGFADTYMTPRGALGSQPGRRVAMGGWRRTSGSATPWRSARPKHCPARTWMSRLLGPPSGGAEGCCSHAAPRPECRLPIPLHGSVADALQRTVMRPWGPSSQIRVPGHEHDTNDKLQEMLITMLRGTSPQGSDAHEPPSLTPHGRKRWSFTCWNIVCRRPA